MSAGAAAPAGEPVPGGEPVTFGRAAGAELPASAVEAPALDPALEAPALDAPALESGVPGAEPAPAPDFVPPRTPGSGATLGVLLSLVVLGAATVAIHDGLVLLGVVGGTGWVRSAADAVGVLTPSQALAWIGLGAAVLGLVIVVASIWPRRRYGMRLRGAGGLYVREVDVARLASGAARGVGSVLEASSTASRRAVVVRARTTIDKDAGELAKSAVTERLAVLREPPTVVVRTRRPR